MNTQRLNKLIELMKTNNFNAIVLNPGYSLRYLTNLDFHLMERPTVLIIKSDGKHVLILPQLEVSRAEKSFEKENLFSYGDNPSSWSDVFFKASAFLNLGKSNIGVESTRLRFLELDFLKNAFQDSQFLSADSVFSNFRIQKDEIEIANMKKAADIAQKALLDTLDEPVVGKTEKEIASKLTINLLKNGSGEIPFSPIVAAGVNSADPHATPSDHVIQPGELLLFDWGASYEGYTSDITRTFAIGEVEPIFYKISEIVKNANQEAIHSTKPNIPAGSVDDAARKVINQTGYGEFFNHRTGHGLGMEAHESPYIYSENTLLLKPGMTFTIEPGIYLSGKGGVRIEDNVVITQTGAVSLTDLPRELLTIR